MRDQTLVLIPSPLVIPFSYHFLKRRLTKVFKLHIPTVPSSAMTYSRKFLWNENDYAAWLLDYLHENKIGRCFLLGHSNSGPIAIRFAELYPEKVMGVILADTIGVEQRSYVKTLWGRVVDAFIEWKLTLWGFHHLIWNFIFHMPNFLYQIRASMRTDILKTATKLKVPVLILWGRRDHTIPLFLGEKLHDSIPSSTLHISEEGSHDWLITHAFEANKVISEWTMQYSHDAGNVLEYTNDKTAFPPHLTPGHSSSPASGTKGHLH